MSLFEIMGYPGSNLRMIWGLFFTVIGIFLGLVILLLKKKPKKKRSGE